MICSEGMLTHLFFPVRKFGLGPGQIQTLVVSSSLWIGWLKKLNKEKKKKKEEIRRHPYGGLIWRT